MSHGPSASGGAVASAQEIPMGSRLANAALLREGAVKPRHGDSCAVAICRRDFGHTPLCRSARGGGPLRPADVRAAGGADLAVAPRLDQEPLHGIVTVPMPCPAVRLERQVVVVRDLLADG